jgi:hypothetical protein
MIDKFVNFFKKKKEVEKPYIEVSDDIVFNVDNFNEWFNDPNNNAVYAHSGIFLRLDKLSESHIRDYIKNRFDIKEPDYDKIYEFYYKIRDDWRAKLNER